MGINFGNTVIKQVSVNTALSMYRRTLESINGQFLMEIPSALFVTTKDNPVEVSYKARPKKPGEIGRKIDSVMTGDIRKELHELAEVYNRYGMPFASMGAPYYSVPDKSFPKVVDLLTKGPEYVFPVVRRGFVELWKEFWKMAIPIRIERSTAMLEAMRSQPDVFTKGNENAGTGYKLRGIRLKRSDLVRLNVQPSELEFILGIMAASAIGYAATQCVLPGPGKVWMVEIRDPRLYGSLGARSDVDLEQGVYSDGKATMNTVSQCRQIFANGGLLANAKTERQLFGESVTATIWKTALRKWGMSEKMKPPIFTRELLFDYWTTHTYDSAESDDELVLIGQDYGMTEPFKAGADTLGCGGFTKIRDKVIPMLESGAWYTTLSYVPAHIDWGQKLDKAKIYWDAVPLGDDFTFRVKKKHFETGVAILKPYDKLKSVKGMISKILGMVTIRDGDTWYLLISLRLLRSTTTASAIGGAYEGVTTMRIGEEDFIKIKIPNEVEESVQGALDVMVKLAFQKGTREELRRNLPLIFGKASNLTYKYAMSWLEHMEPESE
jgi:hypothetical protein